MSYEARATRVHKSLLEIKTIGGVERKMAIANATISVALVMGTEQPLFLLLWIGIHFFLMWVTKKDPFALKIYTRYTKQGDVYDPWPRRIVKRNQRPEGFGRNMLC